jgi:hypothetical protein
MSVLQGCLPVSEKAREKNKEETIRQRERGKLGEKKNRRNRKGKRKRRNRRNEEEQR